MFLPRITKGRTVYAKFVLYRAQRTNVNIITWLMFGCCHVAFNNVHKFQVMLRISIFFIPVLSSLYESLTLTCLNKYHCYVGKHFLFQRWLSRLFKKQTFNKRTRVSGVLSRGKIVNFGTIMFNKWSMFYEH